MSALPIFSELSDRGILLRVDGQDLVLSPNTALTPGLVSMVKKEKSALIRQLEEIKEKAGPDWQEIANDPTLLKTFTELLMIGEMRENGIAPDHYTAVTECMRCGPVPIFEGLPDKVEGCPWCMNRIRGLPIPGHDQ